MNTVAAVGIGHNSASVGEMVAEDPRVVYRDEGILPGLLSEIEGEIAAANSDVSTKSGREEIASLAYSIARRKTPIIAAGKALTEDWRKQTASVNALRSRVEKEFDALRDKARADLDAWEATENDRIERIRQALMAISEAGVVPAGASVEDIEARIARVSEIAIDDSFAESKERAATARAEALVSLRNARDEAVQAEEDRKELARLRAEAEERQRMERAQEAERLAKEAEQAKIDEAARRATEAAEARARAEADAAIAAERKKADDAARALADEQRRQREAQEADARAAAEVARRQADIEHRSAVMRSAKEALMAQSGLSEATVKKVVLAVASGAIPSIQINF